MSTYTEPIVLPKCRECGVSHVKPEGLGTDGACADRAWCLRYRTEAR